MKAAKKMNVLPLGEELRNRRREMGLTLKDVADGAGLSVGFISQVERGLTAPSLSSLAGIARVLDTHVTHFLAVPSGNSPMTRNDRRSIYSVDDSSLGYERISSKFPDSVLNSVIIHEPPGHRSEPIRHEGEEIFFILEGSITVEVDGETNILNPGDSIHFESTRCHSTWNHTTQPARILHTCTMDVFGDEQSGPDVPGIRARHSANPAGKKISDIGTNEPTGDRES